jgi:integrase
MAHIRKLGQKRWQARYRSPDGREHARNFSREADAKRFAASVETDRARGQWIDPKLPKTRFGDYAAEWFDSMSHVRPGTRLNIEGRLRNHINPFFEDMALGTIKPNHIRAWLSELSVKGLSSATINATYRCLAKILKTAELDAYIARTPCIGIDLPKETHHEEMRFMSPEEVARLAEAITPRYRSLVYTAAYTGLRWGELAALKVERLNLLRGSVDVVEAVAEVNGYLHFGPTKTGARRTVSMPRFLCDMLGEHLTQNGAPAHGLAFTSAKGKPLRRNFYRRHFKPAVLSTQVEGNLRFHDLRHTCAALLIAQGAHPKEIQEHLGHSTIRLTFDRYGHLFPHLSERLTDGLEASYRGSLADSTRTEALKGSTVEPLPNKKKAL